MHNLVHENQEQYDVVDSSWYGYGKREEIQDRQGSLLRTVYPMVYA